MMSDDTAAVQPSAGRRWMPLNSAILAVAAVLMLSGTLAAQTGNTLLQREIARALARLGAADEFAVHMRQAATPEAALQMGDLLAHRGIARLDTPTLQLRAEVLNKLFTSADLTTCTQWSRGTLDPARALALLNSLDSVTTSRWAEVSARAMVAEMNAITPAMPPTPTEAREAFAAVASAMNATDQARFGDVLPRLASASDAETCWFSRAAYSSVLRLPAGPRGRALNVFARIESQ